MWKHLPVKQISKTLNFKKSGWVDFDLFAGFSYWDDTWLNTENRIQKGWILGKVGWVDGLRGGPISFIFLDFHVGRTHYLHNTENRIQKSWLQIWEKWSRTDRYIDTYIHTYIRTYIHTYIYIYIYKNTYGSTMHLHINFRTRSYLSSRGIAPGKILRT